MSSPHRPSSPASLPPMAPDNPARVLDDEDNAEPSPDKYIRITTWNINGLRNPFHYQPWKRREDFDQLFDTLETDIICFQELKLQRKYFDDGMVLVPGFDSFFSLPNRKKGYSGVAIYTRRDKCTPIRAEEGITGVLHNPEDPTSYKDLPASEQIGGYPTAAQLAGYGLDAAQLDSEGRALILEFPGFVFIGTYCPAIATSRDNFRLGFLNALDARVRNLIALGKHVVLAGDLNVSCLPKDNRPAHELMMKLKKTEKDFVDSPERRWINQLLQDGTVYGQRDPGRDGVMVDIVRKFNPDDIGLFTCWDVKKNHRPANYGSRIDHIFCSKSMEAWFEWGGIQQDIQGSDHCPVFAIISEVVTYKKSRRRVCEILNPKGMFKKDVRQRDPDRNDLLPLSGRRMPEFDRRRNIKDMFAKQDTEKLDLATDKQSDLYRRGSNSDRPIKVEETSLHHSLINGGANVTRESNGKGAANARQLEKTRKAQAGPFRTKTILQMLAHKPEHMSEERFHRKVVEYLDDVCDPRPKHLSPAESIREWYKEVNPSGKLPSRFIYETPEEIGAREHREQFGTAESDSDEEERYDTSPPPQQSPWSSPRLADRWFPRISDLPSRYWTQYRNPRPGGWYDEPVVTARQKVSALYANLVEEMYAEDVRKGIKVPKRKRARDGTAGDAKSSTSASASKSLDFRDGFCPEPSDSILRLDFSPEPGNSDSRFYIPTEHGVFYPALLDRYSCQPPPPRSARPSYLYELASPESSITTPDHIHGEQNPSYQPITAANLSDGRTASFPNRPTASILNQSTSPEALAAFFSDGPAASSSDGAVASYREGPATPFLKSPVATLSEEYASLAATLLKPGNVYPSQQTGGGAPDIQQLVAESMKNTTNSGALHMHTGSTTFEGAAQLPYTLEDAEPEPEDMVFPMADQEAWARFFDRFQKPRCEHGDICINLVTKKKGVNCGRSFWICPRPIGPSGSKEHGTEWRCSTFIWSSDWHPAPA